MQDSSLERSQEHWVKLAVDSVLYSLELKTWSWGEVKDS